jgi:3-oxoacyl-[acyl-carrier-protein] synthase-3
VIRRATIAGTGYYAPERVIENDYFDKRYNRDMSTFLAEQRNIFQRRWMSEDQTTSDLIVPAAEAALKAAGIKATDLNLIIIATDTPDYISPSTASVVQYRLGATHAGSFDLNTACAGFVTAVDTASKYIAADEQYNNVLVVGAYAMTKYFDWDDYKVTSVFADGAGAAILQRSTSDEFGILASQLYTDGQYHDHMGIYAGGARYPINESTLQETLDNKRNLLNFAKRIPPEMNAIQWPRLTYSILDRIKKDPLDIEHYFFTQINIHSIHHAMDAIRVPKERAHNIMDRFGYTGSACLPMALADADSQGKLKRGDLVMMLGSGGGMSMAAMALRWS